MKKPTIAAWLFTLAKYLASKAVAAAVSYKSTELLLQAFAQELNKIPSGTAHVPPNSTAGVLLHMLEQLSKGASNVLTGWVVPAIISVAIVTGAAYAVSHYYDNYKPRSRVLFLFSLQKIRLVEALSLLIGKLVVPFTVICTMMYELSEHFSAYDKSHAIVYTVVIIGIVIALHGIAFFGKQPQGIIVYTLTAPRNQKNHSEKSLLQALAKFVANSPYVGKPEVQTESIDGTISVAIPIQYPAEKWSSDERTQFVRKLRDVELAWKASDYSNIRAFIPENVQSSIPVKLKNPRDKKAA